MPYSRTLSRDDVIARLSTIVDVIAEDLADESSDRQLSLENTERYLSTLIRRMKLDEAKDAADAKEIAGNLETLLDRIGVPVSVQSECPVCGGCPAGPGCIGAFILDDHKACTCPPKTAPVVAQTI